MKVINFKNQSYDTAKEILDNLESHKNQFFYNRFSDCISQEDIYKFDQVKSWIPLALFNESCFYATEMVMVLKNESQYGVIHNYNAGGSALDSTIVEFVQTVSELKKLFKRYFRFNGLDSVTDMRVSPRFDFNEKLNELLEYTTTLEDYREECIEFFKENDLDTEDKIKQNLKGKDLEQSIKWIYNIYDRYNYFYQTIAKLVQKIRKDYNGVDGNDPLYVPENKELVQGYKKVYNEVCDTYFCNTKTIKKILEEDLKIKQEQQEKEALNIEVKNQKFTALAKCDVLWSGWECDASAWVVEDNGETKLVTSNHGELNFTNKSFLEEKIKEYQEAIKDSEKLLEMLK